MFASRNIPDGAVIVEEQSLLRLLCFDLYARPQDHHAYNAVIDTLNQQFESLSTEDRHFIETLEPFLGEETYEQSVARLDLFHDECPFILRIMKKYGFEAYHQDFFHCAALFQNICRVNHACDFSNAWLDNWGNQNDWSTGTLRARRDIKEGEEILLDYTHLGGKVYDKMEVLRKYRFICAYWACTSCYAAFDS